MANLTLFLHKNSSSLAFITRICVSERPSFGSENPLSFTFRTLISKISWLNFFAITVSTLSFHFYFHFLKNTFSRLHKSNFHVFLNIFSSLVTNFMFIPIIRTEFIKIIIKRIINIRFFLRARRMSTKSRCISRVVLSTLYTIWKLFIRSI